MKRIFTLLMVWVACANAILAALAFDPNTKYRMECKLHPGGSVGLGASHGASPYLYYLQGDVTSADVWWYIRKEAKGYTLTNAQTGQYITYSSERIPQVAKGLVLTTTASADASSYWQIEAVNGQYVVRNQQATNQVFNLRKDGTYLLGTFAGNGDVNELFTFYDEAGNRVGETQEPGGTPEVNEDYLPGTKGKNRFGEYWELVGAEQPVAYTTDVTDPVLYSIVNLRRGSYVTASSYHMLEQAKDPNLRTRFYFVKQEKGVQVYTEDGRRVSTSFPKDQEGWGSLLLTKHEGSEQIWNFDWYDSGEKIGYVFRKSDCLPDVDTLQSKYLYWNDYGGRSIGLYDLDMGSIFVLSSADERHVKHLLSQGIAFDESQLPTVTTFAEAFDSLRLGNKQLIYDTRKQSYLLPLNISLRQGGDWTTNLTYKLKPSYAGHVVKVDGQTADSLTGNITIKDVDCETEYALSLCDSTDQEVLKSTLRFTFLPIVEVNVPSCNGKAYTTGSIRVTNGNVTSHDSTYIAAFKYRGATAQSFTKKSYAVKFCDAAGNPVDRSFFGLRTDNKWILDAMAVDPSCMRNRLATDLWNDFSEPPYYKDREPKARTGTRGQFVEVFLNGRYHGLYCMTEKLDRKQLRLKKFVPAALSTTGKDEIHGLLYKSKQWGYEVFMGHESDKADYPQRAPQPFTNQMGKETWANYEQKYPDYETEAVEWKPLWDAVNFVATSGLVDFGRKVKRNFDYPVVRDYYLFIELLLATDNHGKNMFYYVYDQTGPEGTRISVAPWDMDGAWGARWDGSTKLTYADQDYDQFLRTFEHGEHTLFYKLRRTGQVRWKDDLAKRYADLRTTYFDDEKLAARVEQYARLFADSKADTREQERWGQYHENLQEAASYMQSWVKDRIASLDQKYGYDPLISGINEAQAEAYLRVKGEKGSICITAGKSQSLAIYSLNGTLVRQVRLQPGLQVLQGFQPGIYLVGSQKVVVN